MQTSFVLKHVIFQILNSSVFKVATKGRVSVVMRFNVEIVSFGSQEYRRRDRRCQYPPSLPAKGTCLDTICMQSGTCNSVRLGYFQIYLNLEENRRWIQISISFRLYRFGRLNEVNLYWVPRWKCGCKILDKQ